MNIHSFWGKIYIVVFLDLKNSGEREQYENLLKMLITNNYIDKEGNSADYSKFELKMTSSKEDLRELTRFFDTEEKKPSIFSLMEARIIRDVYAKIIKSI